MRSFTFLKQPMLEDTSYGHEKDPSLFRKGQSNGMYQTEITSREIADPAKTVLRKIQRIIMYSLGLPSFIVVKKRQIKWCTHHAYCLLYPMRRVLWPGVAAVVKV